MHRWVDNDDDDGGGDDVMMLRVDGMMRVCAIQI